MKKINISFWNTKLLGSETILRLKNQAFRKFQSMSTAVLTWTHYTWYIFYGPCLTNSWEMKKKVPYIQHGRINSTAERTEMSWTLL